MSLRFTHFFRRFLESWLLLLECMSRIFSMCRFCGLDDRHGAGWLSKRKLEYWLRVHILSYCCWALDELLMKVICHWIQNLYTLCTYWRKGVNREKPFLNGLGSWAVVNKDRDQKKKQIFQIIHVWDFFIDLLLSQNVVVAIYTLFLQNFWDWKAESAEFFAFRKKQITSVVRRSSPLVSLPLWNGGVWKRCKTIDSFMCWWILSLIGYVWSAICVWFIIKLWKFTF